MIQEQSQRDTTYQLTGQIARQLGEKAKAPLITIRRIVHAIGPERAQAFVEQALAVEAGGGMWLEKQNRRRTLGGVFFHLVRSAVTDEERQRIWRDQPWRHRTPAPARPTPPVLTEEDLPKIVAEIIKDAGETRTVKITIIGRPSEVVERQCVVVLGMRSSRAPDLPKGLPAPHSEPTNYMIFVSAKQWRRVAEAIKNLEDALIIEGYPSCHPKFAGIAVYATQVSTKLQQRAKREQQAEAGRARKGV
jgi:hypothetical protein